MIADLIKDPPDSTYWLKPIGSLEALGPKMANRALPVLLNAYKNDDASLSDVAEYVEQVGQMNAECERILIEGVESPKDVGTVGECALDGFIVFWIIRALFEPADLQQQIPEPMIWVIANTSQFSQVKKWPIGPMAIVDGVPFMLGSQTMGSGVAESPSSHIRWVRKFGVMRDQLLKPSSSPIIAAEKLLSSKRFLALPGDQRFETDRIREHAIAMLEASNLFDEDFGFNEVEWQKRLESTEGSQIWNVEEQRFELPK